MERERRQTLPLGQLPSYTRKGAAAKPVKVTCTMSLPLNQTDMNQLEAAIFQAGLRVMVQHMTQALTMFDPQGDRVCLPCGSSTVVGDGRSLFHLHTRFGTVPVNRRHSRCTACGWAVRPP